MEPDVCTCSRANILYSIVVMSLNGIRGVRLGRMVPLTTRAVLMVQPIMGDVKYFFWEKSSYVG